MKACGRGEDITSLMKKLLVSIGLIPIIFRGDAFIEYVATQI